MPDVRRAHVKRFYGKDETADGGPDNSQVWIDIELIDSIVTETGRGFDYQKTVWSFSFDDSDRATVLKRIKNPDDESRYIDISVNVRVRIEYARGFVYQKTVLNFDNSASSARRTHTKRVYSNNIGDEFLDADRQPPRNPQEYLDAVLATGEQDQTQFVDVDVIDAIVHEAGRGFVYQQTVRTLNWRDDILMQEPLVPLTNV